MSFALEKIMTEVSGHIQSQIFDKCGISYFRWFYRVAARSRGLPRSRDKLKPLYLHYHSAYWHQTGYYGDLPWVAPIHNVT